MGLKDKLKNKQNGAGSNAIVLCDLSVDRIFNRCIASATTLPSDFKKVYLFSHTSRVEFEDTTRPINFDKTKLAENYKKILFMFGQLEIVHNEHVGLTPDNSHLKYDGTKWNREDSSLMQLYYLAIAANIMFRFYPMPKIATIHTERVIPTLSPNDPNFPVWWEEHKAEWED